MGSSSPVDGLVREATEWKLVVGPLSGPSHRNQRSNHSGHTVACQLRILLSVAATLCVIAIVAVRFDTTELGDVWTEICAYGTAVQAVPVTDAAKYTAQQLGYGGGA
jgi:hypothetical protein